MSFTVHTHSPNTKKKTAHKFIDYGHAAQFAEDLIKAGLIVFISIDNHA